MRLPLVSGCRSARGVGFMGGAAFIVLTRQRSPRIRTLIGRGNCPTQATSRLEDLLPHRWRLIKCAPAS